MLFRIFILLICAISLLHAEDKIVVVKPGDSLHAALRKNPAIIRLEPGVHRLSGTLVLTEANSGLTIENVSEKPAFIVGAEVVFPSQWKPVNGRPGLWTMTVPENFPVIRSVFFDRKPLPRSRSKGYRQLTKPSPAGPGQVRIGIDENHLYAPPALFQEITNFDSAILRVVPKYPWVCHLLPVSRVDQTRGLISSDVRGTYPMDQPAFGHFPDGTLWIENTPEGIDEPGEWSFNHQTRELILKTPDGKEPGNRVELPRLTELIRIEGRENATDFSDHPVKEITIRGITFARTNAFAWEPDKIGRGLQHDWEMHDRSTAMVRLRFTENCRIEDCRFIRSGATGVRMDLHALKNSVQHCEFSELGGAGIVLAGYGMGFKDVNRENLIADNNIHNIGQRWWHSPAIFAWQSGHNKIIHNHVHHLPHNGITVSGRTQLDVSGRKECSKTARMDEVNLHLDGLTRSWENREPLMHSRQNEVAWNDIHHVMETLADGNAIYISGAGGGNRIHHNFIHDVTGANMNGTIRVDDDQHEVKIDHNIIARCAGEGILWKGRCEIINNLIYHLRTKTPNGVPTQHQRGFLVISGPVAGSVVKHNLIVSNHPRLPILFEREDPWLKHGRPAPAMRLDQTESDHNIYWNPVNPQWAADFFKKQRARGVEKNSVFAEPVFTDPPNNDFTTQQGSVIDSTGFSRIDLKSAGPRPLSQ